MAAAAGGAGKAGVKVGFVAEKIVVEPGAGFGFPEGPRLSAVGADKIGGILIFNGDVESTAVAGKDYLRDMPGFGKAEG
jgi:hypothetical protein